MDDMPKKGNLVERIPIISTNEACNCVMDDYCLNSKCRIYQQVGFIVILALFSSSNIIRFLSTSPNWWVHSYMQQHPDHNFNKSCKCRFPHLMVMNFNSCLGKGCQFHQCNGTLYGLVCSRRSLHHSEVSLQVVWRELLRSRCVVAFLHFAQLRLLLLVISAKFHNLLQDFGDSIPGHGGFTDRMDCQVRLYFGRGPECIT